MKRDGIRGSQRPAARPGRIVVIVAVALIGSAGAAAAATVLAGHSASTSVLRACVKNSGELKLVGANES